MLQQAKIKAQRKADSLLQKQRRAAAKRVAANRLTEAGADGISPQMRAQLAAAERRIESDPRAKAIIDRAETAARVAELRRKQGFDKVKPAPVYEFGRPVAAPAEPPAKTVAEQLEERRAAGIMPSPAPRQPTPGLVTPPKHGNKHKHRR